MSGEFNPTKLLRLLVEHEVRFIVVGGVAATLLGSPLATQDLDLVYDLADDNLLRLAAALEQVNARYNDPAGRLILPDAEKLGKFKVNLLKTDLGNMDLLREIGPGLTFSKLTRQTVEYLVDDLRIRSIDVETLIEAKEIAGRPKDLLALPFLRQLESRADSE